MGIVCFAVDLSGAKYVCDLECVDGRGDMRLLTIFAIASIVGVLFGIMWMFCTMVTIGAII